MQVVLVSLLAACLSGATTLVDRSAGSTSGRSTEVYTAAHNATIVGIAVRDTGLSTQHLFVFGDSYSNIGFDWQGRRPTAQNPLGNPTWPGRNLCKCKTWVNYLATDYTWAADQNRRTLTYDFADDCATVDASLAKCTARNARSLIDQVNDWREMRARTATSMANEWTSNRALYALWFGANDAQLIFGSMIDSKRTAILWRYFQQIDYLYSQGVRNFLIMGVPAIWRTPMVLRQPLQVQRDWEKSTNDWNWDLYQKVLQWRQEHADATMVIADMKPLSEWVMNNPGIFGARDAVCDGGSNCLWSDVFHPGEAMHQQFARCAVSKMARQGLGGFFKDVADVDCP